MQKIAKFFKVSYPQFEKDWQNAFGEVPQNLQEIYGKIKMPKRATAGSAGYDIFCPINLTVPPKTQILVPTGLRAQMKNGAFLAIFPRSGLGFKFRLQLNNTVGIIDADYFGADNEGHIMLKVFNDSADRTTVEIAQGTGIAQGIFLPFGITEDDEATEVRVGGFGSTSK